MIYDPKKTFLNSEPKDEQIKQEEIKSDEEDSLMEDMTPKTIQKDSPDVMKKAKSHHPALMKLAASPEKGENQIDQQKINYSKVYLKRDYLYSELKSIPVTVEQQSNLQILEDFLRNKIKTMDNVKNLKFDYGFGDRGPASSMSPFGSAFGGHYQSITQKILRKNLGNGARKILDTANVKLAKILNSGNAYKIKQSKKKKGDEEMASPDDKKDEDTPDEDSQGYGDMEDEDEDQDEQEM